MRAVRRFLILLLIAAAVFLIGGGRSWFEDGEPTPQKPAGGEGNPSPGAEGGLPGLDGQQADTSNAPSNAPPNASPPNAPPNASPPNASPSLTSRPTTDADPAEVGSRPAGGSSADNNKAGSLTAADIDRRLGRLHKAERALETGRIGDALDALERLHREGMLDSMLPRFAELRTRARRNLSQALKTMSKQIRTGQVLRARRLLQKVIEPEVALVQKAVQALCRENGWPAPRGALDALKPALAVATRPAFSGGERVQLPADGEGWRAAVVHGVKGSRLTLRIAHEGGGVRFPAVDQLAVEIVNANSRQALAQARHAASTKNSELARLWLCCCLSNDSELSHRVRAALPARYVGR